MLRDGDAGYPEHRSQLFGRNLERSGSRADAGNGLGVGRRARRMEGHVALDLLHDLMNVSVQHRHRAETAQLAEELFRIPGTPAPGFVDRPERHVCEYDDRRAGRPMLQVRGHPGELLVTQCTETARLELYHVDQADEMHAGMIE